jgi:hypothetical protein
MASGCRCYLRSSAFGTGDGGRRPAVLGWEEVVGGSARRRLPVTTTTQSVRSKRQGRGGFEVGLGARIYLGVQTVADGGNDGRRLAASGFGGFGPCRRATAWARGNPGRAAVGARRRPAGLIAWRRMRDARSLDRELVRGWRRWGEKRGRGGTPPA